MPLKYTLTELGEVALKCQCHALETHGGVDALVLIYRNGRLDIMGRQLCGPEHKYALFDYLAFVAAKLRPDAIVWCDEAQLTEITADRTRYLSPPQRNALYRTDSRWLLEYGFARVWKELVATAQSRATYVEIRAPFTREDGRVVWGERKYSNMAQSRLPPEQNASRFFREQEDDDDDDPCEFR